MATAATTFARRKDGVEVPVAGTWVLDPAHTSISFVARHMMVTRVRGGFSDFEGAIHVSEDPGSSWAEARIGGASISTGVKQRDEHLISNDFLATSENPDITFRSTSLQHVDGERWKATGGLTIRGIEREVELDVVFGGSTQGMAGPIAFFSAHGEIDREDWGITWNQTLETGGVLVSKKVKIEIEAQAVLKTDQ